MKTHQLVEQVLSENPRARQDDKYLLLKVWQKQGLPIPSQEFIEKFLSKGISAAEAVTRLRRKLHEEGKYLPPTKVQEARYEKAENIRQNIRTEPLTLF